MQMPRTASDEHRREEEDAARKALRTWLSNGSAPWTALLRHHERLLTKSWGGTARRFRDGMDGKGVVLRDDMDRDVTELFIKFLCEFSLDDEVSAGEPTGRKQHVAAGEMFEAFSMTLSVVEGGLFTTAQFVLDDRVLLLSIRKEKRERGGIPLFP